MPGIPVRPSPLAGRYEREGKQMLIVGIDPGASGGFAWHTDTTRIETMNMPDTMADIYNLLEEITAGHDDAFILMEKVGTYMPGNSGPSASKFAMHVGALKMALIAIKVPHDLVTPQKWQASFIGKPDYDKIPVEVQGKARTVILTRRKQERKNKIKARSQMLYPEVTLTLKTSDAIGIMWYAIEERRGMLL